MAARPDSCTGHRSSSRRLWLVWGDVGRAIALMSLPSGYWLGSLRLVQFYVIVAAAGALTVAFDVAQHTYVPAILPRKRLLASNNTLLGTQSVAQLLGPPTAGVVIASFGAANTIALDSASFLASCALILSTRHREPRHPAAAQRSVRGRSLPVRDSC